MATSPSGPPPAPDLPALPAVAPHAVAGLRDACLQDNSARPSLDRGPPRKPRCAGCRLPPSHCQCALRPVVPTRAAVCLLMAEFEPLRPSNTGWLVADVVPDTWAFSWSRVHTDPALLALLADPQWQPLVVFPGEFAGPGREVVTALPEPPETPDGPGTPPRRPLFILLDGTWSEARKIFNKSPWLHPFPVLSLQPEQLSRYRLRRSTHAHHFCTAEVAALCLALAGDERAAQTLEAWLEVFSSRYLRARQSVGVDEADEGHLKLKGLMAGAHDPPASPR